MLYYICKQDTPFINYAKPQDVTFNLLYNQVMRYWEREEIIPLFFFVLKLTSYSFYDNMSI